MIFGKDIDTIGLDRSLRNTFNFVLGGTFMLALRLFMLVATDYGKKVNDTMLNTIYTAVFGFVLLLTLVWLKKRTSNHIKNLIKGTMLLGLIITWSFFILLAWVKNPLAVQLIGVISFFGYGVINTILYVFSSYNEALLCDLSLQLWERGSHQ